MNLVYDFMIAVYGTLLNIIVPLFKLDKQNRADKKFLDEVHQDLDRAREWKERVADQEMTIDFAAKLYELKDGFEFNKNEPTGLFKEIDDTLKEMHWLTFKDAVVLAPRPETREFYLRILLANRGKLMPSDASCGIEKFKACGHKPEDTAEFVLWIDKKLKEHGINERPVYSCDAYNISQNISFTEYHYLNNPTDKGMRYMWKPNVANRKTIIDG